jgi:hypothetical protein
MVILCVELVACAAALHHNACWLAAGGWGGMIQELCAHLDK